LFCMGGEGVSRVWELDQRREYGVGVMLTESGRGVTGF
jgi:hypothetical protein